MTRLPDWLTTWRRKRTLKRFIRKLEDEFRPQLAKAGGHEEQALLSELVFELQDPQSELANLETARLRRRAHRWNVDPPDSEFDHQTGRWYIADAPRRQLRRDIRDARRASIQWCIQVVVMPLIALLGVTIGLIGLLASTLKSN